MHGFKPQAHRRKPQHLADGGMVKSIKNMLGFKPEDPEKARMLAEYRANKEREKQVDTASKPVEQKAITSYAGNSALKRREKEQGLKDGGMIRGKGTGTSDSIPRGFKPGTFIMPADSTKAIGPEVLERMGKVPTKVSNGEFAHTPEQVHAVGIDTLNRMKDATHKPVDEKINQALYLANGGEVENDVLRVGNSYSGANIGGNITVNGAEAKGGYMVAPGQATLLAKPAIAPAAVPGSPVAAPGGAPIAAPGITPVAATPGVVPAKPALPGAVPGAAAPVTPGVPAVAPPAAAVSPPVNSFTARNAAVSASSITKNGGRFDQTPLAQSPGKIAPEEPIPPRRPLVSLDPVQAAQAFSSGGEVRGFQPRAQRLSSGGAVLDEQAKRDRERLGALAAGVGDANQNAGRAILDVATMVPRGLAGAYDSAVVRPMRAAGINAGYLSPHLVPDGVDPASMTPFTDQKRLQERNAAGAGHGFVNPSLSSKAVAPVTNLTVPETQTDVQRGGGNVAAVEAQATQPSAQPAPAQPVAQALAQVPSLAPVQAQGFQAPTVRHSGNDWQSRQDLRNASVSARSITNKPGWSGAGMARFHGQSGDSESTMKYKALLANDMAMRGQEVAGEQKAMTENQAAQRLAMQQNAENQRTTLREQGFQSRDQRRAGVDERELAMKENAAGFATRAAAQSEQLRNVLLNPESTPEQRRTAQQQLAALQDKTNDGKFEIKVTPATKNVDGSTTPGSVWRWNTATGEAVEIGAQAATALPPGMVKQVGTSGGKPVYEDANGKQFGG